MVRSHIRNEYPRNRLDCDNSRRGIPYLAPRLDLGEILFKSILNIILYPKKKIFLKKNFLNT